MPQGTLEVLLVSAKWLENTDFLGITDPYVILTWRSQEQRSRVASGRGTEPEWNESFAFAISDRISELTLKIMDSDAGGGDDCVGEVKIPLGPLFLEGRLPPAAYNVVKDEEFCGEIRVGLTFTPEVRREQDFHVEEESYGGWNEFAYKESCRERDFHVEEESYGGWKEFTYKESCRERDFYVVEESYGGWKESAYGE